MLDSRRELLLQTVIGRLYLALDELAEDAERLAQGQPEIARAFESFARELCDAMDAVRG